MPDDNALRRWFSLEMNKILETFVPVPVPLHDLLRERTPKAITRSGEPHLFDPNALKAFAEALPALTRAQVRLPMTIHLDNETPGNAFAADPATIEALRALKVTGSPPRDGKLWVSVPLLRDLANRYPTLIQFVMR